MAGRAIMAFIVGYFGAGAFHPDHGSLARNETVWSVFGITAYVGGALLYLLALMAFARLVLWLGRRVYRLRGSVGRPHSESP